MQPKPCAKASRELSNTGLLARWKVQTLNSRKTQCAAWRGRITQHRRVKTGSQLIDDTITQEFTVRRTCLDAWRPWPTVTTGTDMVAR